jgi:hypothetical protein
VAVALGAVVAVALAVSGGSGGGGSSATTSSVVAPDMTDVKTFTGLSRSHVQGRVVYAQTPPVGGDHAPVWQNCGYYAEAVPAERGVHSMEHGAVWLTYRPDLAADQIAVLRRLAQRQGYVLVSPFPGLPTPVVASAWGLQLQLPSATDARLAEFVRLYRQGPQTPEPGAACTGGSGTPDTG